MKFFHSSLLCLRLLLTPRALVWIRRDAPALLILPGFLIGQVLPTYAAFAAVIAVFYSRWHCTAGIMLGVVTSLLSYSRPLASVDSNLAHYIVRVTDLSFPRVGEIEFEGVVVGRLSLEGEEPINQIAPYLARFRAVHLAWRNSALLRKDSLVVVFASLSPIDQSASPLSFDGHLVRHAISAVGKAKLVSEPIENIKFISSNDSSDDVTLNEEQGVMHSLALGSRDVVSQDLERIFRTLGLSHILVFSGFQVMLVGGLVWRLVQSVCVRLALASRADIAGGVLGIIASVALTGMSGWEPSGIRALVAFIFLFTTILIRGSACTAIQRWAVGLIGVSVIFPGALFEPGVQLTFAALLGLICSARGGVVVPSITATFFTSLVSLWWFGEWTPLAIILNPIVAPLLTITGCLIGYPVLGAQYLARTLGLGAELADCLVSGLGKINLGIIRFLGQSVSPSALLSPTGTEFAATAAVLLSTVLFIVTSATIRYFMGNGVRFGDEAKRI